MKSTWGVQHFLHFLCIFRDWRTRAKGFWNTKREIKQVVLFNKKWFCAALFFNKAISYWVTTFCPRQRAPIFL